MIDQRKVTAMTRMASYEANEGKKHIEVNRYFRSDFIGLQLLKGWLSGTVSFVLMVFLRVIYDIELFTKEMYQSDIGMFIKHWIIIYLVFIAVYMLCCYILALLKYNRARQGIRRYYISLKHLLKYYE